MVIAGQSRPLQPVREPDLGTLERARRVLQARHYSVKTVKAYLFWIDRFARYHHPAPVADLREAEVNDFLTHLATDENVTASTQNQALSALLFLYDKVLGRPLDRIDGVTRARRSLRCPTVLSRAEVQALFKQLDGAALLVRQLLYGSGLRLNEALGLRILDVDFHRREISVRQTKGRKDRITMLPTISILPLKRHIAAGKRLHETDLAAGLGRVPLPFALARKYPNAEREWAWQWVFPASSYFVDASTGVAYRYHLHASVVQKAVRAAAERASIPKHVTPTPTDRRLRRRRLTGHQVMRPIDER